MKINKIIRLRVINTIDCDLNPYYLKNNVVKKISLHTGTYYGNLYEIAEWKEIINLKCYGFITYEHPEEYHQFMLIKFKNLNYIFIDLYHNINSNYYKILL